MSDVARRAAANDDGYEVRTFRAGDREGFLDLFTEVFGEHHGREWFDWKYGDNPYVDHVPAFVAVRDGEVVGARPMFALEMAVGDERHLALQPADAMVHPDHRRRGLFTRLTEAAIDRYERGEPDFFFNFPNELSGAGNLKLGWRPVGERRTYYRVQDPAALVANEADAGWATGAGRLARPAVAAYNRFRDVSSVSDDDVTVRVVDGVPAADLAGLARRSPSAGIRAHRDERFYKWRFGNPDWSYRTYMATDAGAPVAGLVVGRSVGANPTLAKVTEVAPHPAVVDHDVLAALLHRAVADHDDVDLVAAPPGLPEPVLTRVGFHPDDRPPLSAVTNRTRHFVRSLTGEWTVGGLDLTDAANWRMTFAEHDTS